MTHWTSAAALAGSPNAKLLPARIRPIQQEVCVIGPAYPARCAPGDNLALHIAVANVKPGDILVATVGGDRDFGYWGEIMTTAALKAGVAALVIDGCVRDAVAIANLGFPVFCTGYCPRSTGKQPNLLADQQAPILIGSTVITPGDLVVADVDGIVVVPAAEVGNSAEYCAQLEVKERELLARIEAGMTTLQALGLDSSGNPVH